MFDPDNIKKALEVFRNKVVSQSKAGLTRQKKTVSRDLYNSIQGSEVKVTQNSLQFNITMSEYASFVDKGVRGADPSAVSKNARIKGQQAPNSPYRFGSGNFRGTWPQFINSLTSWVAAKRLRLRDEKGRFTKGNYKTIAQIVARNIYARGIKPSLFFTTPFEKYYKDLPEDLEKAFALDVEEFIDFINKQNFE